MDISLNIDVSAALHRISEVVDTSDPRVRSSIASALNYATRDLRKESKKILINDMGFPAKRTRDSQFSTTRASTSKLQTTLFISGSPIPMVEFSGVSSDRGSIKVKYIDGSIRSGSDKFFRRTNWHKVQSTYDKAYRSGKPVPTRDGMPLNFLNKKNADRETIMIVKGTESIKPGSKSAFSGVRGAMIDNSDEMFGVSIATGINLPKFEVKYDVFESSILQRRFEEKLGELL